MPHTMVTFRLHRSGVILLMVFGVVLAILIYVAGYLTAVYTRKPPAPPPKPVVAAAAPKPAPAPAPAKKAPAEPLESLTLRVSVVTSEEEAKAEVARLAGFGLEPSIVQLPPTSSGVTLYNVCVGQYETRTAANAAAKELQSRLGFSSVIVPVHPSGNL